MSILINQYLDILDNNKFVPKYKDIPEYIDNRDEILAEMHENMEEDGLLPDSLRYFEVNGFSEPYLLKEYLEKSFMQFRLEFLSIKHDTNSILLKEIEKELNEIKKAIVQTIFESNQINDVVLTEMMDIKARYCDATIEFIGSYKNNEADKPTSDIEDHNKWMDDKMSIFKNDIVQAIDGSNQIKDVVFNEKTNTNKEKHTYKWLKTQEELESLFHKLITNKLIFKDSKMVDFKIIFSNKSISVIKNPIQWESGAKQFADFFDQLDKQKYIAKTPKWIVLKYCFTYKKYRSEEYIPIPEGVKSNLRDIKLYGEPDDLDIIKSLFPLVH